MLSAHRVAANINSILRQWHLLSLELIEEILLSLSCPRGSSLDGISIGRIFAFLDEQNNFFASDNQKLLEITRGIKELLTGLKSLLVGFRLTFETN
jgi:hypothetical protein